MVGARVLGRSMLLLFVAGFENLGAYPAAVVGCSSYWRSLKQCSRFGLCAYRCR